MALWCAPLVISLGVCTLLGLYCLLKGCFACSLLKWPGRLQSMATVKLGRFQTDAAATNSRPRLQAVPGKPLRWSDVTCRLTAGHGPIGHVVVQSASGQANASAVLGIIGPSGAGKTTLLHVLAGREDACIQVKGTVFVSGKPRITATFRQHDSILAEQDQSFTPCLTVAETLDMYCRLQRPGYATASRSEQAAVLSTLLNLVGLQAVQHTRVGGVLAGGLTIRGISGGELKRFSVVCGISRDSSILILDEPTSSLDSFAALCVMRALRQLAAAGHTVIASIHQPPPSIWNLLDEVVLLSNGRTMYMGSASQVEDWFSVALGYPYHPRLHGTLCEWLLQLVTIAFRADLSEPRTMTSVQHIQAAADAWTVFIMGQEIHVTSEQIPESSCSHVQPTIELLSHKAAAADAIISHQYGHQQRSCSFHAIAHKLEAWCWLPKYWSHRRDNNSIHLCHQTSWFAQFKLLFWRSMVINMRNPLDMGARVLVSPCMGVLEGLVFLHLGYDKHGAQGRLLCIADTLLILIVMPFVYMPLLTANKAMLANEAPAKLYNSLACYCAVSLASMPTTIISAIGLTWPVYTLAGFRHSGQALVKASCIYILSHLCSTQVLQVAAFLLPNQDMAMVGAVAYQVLAFQLSGFFRAEADTVGFCRGLGWASYTRYAFQATAQVELEGQQLVCTATSSGVQAENCPTGDTLLGDLHFVLDLKQNSFVLLGFFVGLHVLGAAVVRWRHW